MSKKYKQFFLVITFFTLISLIFSTIFCYVYSKSVNGWFQGGVIGLFIDLFIVSIAIPLIKTIVKCLLRLHWIFRPLLIVDYCFFALNYLL
jgi:hypothetical protein